MFCAFASIYGYFIFGEFPDLFTWLGALVIFIGIFIITYRELILNKNYVRDKLNINN